MVSVRGTLPGGQGAADFLAAAVVLLAIVLAPAIRRKREEVFVED